MKPCLADVNVLLALLVRQHQHHRVARNWFSRLGANEVALCRVVQLALIRLLGNAHVMGDDAVPAAAAWRLIEELAQDERVVFAAEPDRLDEVLPSLFSSRTPASKMVGDAYLAAFAMSSSRRMATLDRGFRQFPGLDVELLAGASGS